MVPPFKYPITFLPCKNLDEMIKFYTEILGLELALEQGDCFIIKIGESPHISYWGFCSHYEDFITPARRVCLTLVVDSPKEVDSWTQNLINQKVKCTRQAQATPQFKIYNAFFEDPMGYTIEVQSFDSDGQPKWH